jgi:hypothetical protein
VERDGFGETLLRYLSMTLDLKDDEKFVFLYKDLDHVPPKCALVEIFKCELERRNTSIQKNEVPSLVSHILS